MTAAPSTEETWREGASPVPGGGQVTHVHLLDTAVASDNVGDEIIMRHLRRLLLQRMPGAYVTTSSSHDGMGRRYGRRLAEEADLVVLMGTNALRLDKRPGKVRLLPLGPGDVRALAGKTVLFGVGASHAFDGEVHWLQKRNMRAILSQRHLHAVRDGSAARMVETCGRRVVNASCPTLWGLPPRMRFEPATRRHVCFSLTYHRKDPDADARFLDWLSARYERLTFWPQQRQDIAYLRSLPGGDRISTLGPNLESYDAFLRDCDADVIGSRLHGGIHALHHGRRAVILAVDNRAREIGAETTLPIVAREEAAEGLDARLARPIEIDLSPLEAGARAFLDQFGPAPTASRHAQTTQTGNGPSVPSAAKPEDQDG